STFISDAIEVSFGKAVFEDGYAFLPIVTGREFVRSARERLYSEFLESHRSLEHSYTPHVTFGRYDSASELSEISLVAARFSQGTLATLDRIVIEAIGADDMSQIIWQRELSSPDPCCERNPIEFR